MFAMYWPWAIVVLPFVLILAFGDIFMALIVAALLYGIIFHLAPGIIAGLGNVSHMVPLLGPEHIFYTVVFLFASVAIGFFYNRRKMNAENTKYMEELTSAQPEFLQDTDALNEKVRYFSEGKPHKTRIFFWFLFFLKDLTFGNLTWLRRSIESDLRSSSRANVEKFAEDARQKKGH